MLRPFAVTCLVAVTSLGWTGWVVAEAETETNNNSASANTLTSGVQMSGNLYDDTDEDYFRINVGSSGTLSIDISSYYNYASVQVLNPSLEVVSGIDYISAGESLSVGVASPGYYYIRIFEGSIRDATTDPYSLTVTYDASATDAETETNNNSASANTLTSGVQMSGNLYDDTDEDYFRINVGSSGTLSIDISSYYNYASVQVLNPSLEVVSGIDYISAGESLSVGVASPGYYYIRIFEGSIRDATTDPYSLTVTYDASATDAETETNNNSASANTLTSGVQMSGNLYDDADEDYFRINVGSSGTLSIDISSYYNYASVQVLNPSLEVVSGIDYISAGESLSVGVASPGYYYIRIFEGSIRDATTDPYSLTVTYDASATDAETETNNNSASANTLTSGVQMSGNLYDDTDEDYFRINVGSSGTLSIDISSYYNYASVQVLNPSLEVVSGIDYISAGESLSVGVASPGYYYIRIFEGSIRDATTDPYSLTVTYTGDSPNAPTLSLQSKTSTSATLAITSNGGGSGPIESYTASCELPSSAIFSRRTPNSFLLGEPTSESRQRISDNQSSTAIATVYRPAPSLSNAAVGDKLTFVTPDGDSHISLVTRSEATKFGNWLLEADADGTRILAVVTSEGDFTASVETTTGRFQAQILDDQTVFYSSQDGQFIDNPFLDDALLPPTLNQDDEAVSRSIIGGLSDTPTVISVGVQYDDSTVSAYNEIALSEYFVAIANQSYQQAGVDIVFDIAGMRQYQPYISDSNLADTLYYISCGSTSCNPLFGVNQNVETWRNQVKADLIVQIVRYGVSINGGTQCGVGWLPQESSHFLIYLKNLTLSVNALESRSGFACDNIVVAHEMGHNFGLGHDRFTSPDFTPYYPYARGFKENSFGTVMSYTNNYILTLSNPYVTYGGRPTGVEIGQFGEAYAARAVENVMSLHEEIYVNSQPVYHTVSTARGPNGSISPSTASVREGASRSFTVVPDPDYAIDVISGCGGSLSGSTYTTESISSPCTISVTFKRSRWSVSGTSSPLVMSGLPTGETFNCIATLSDSFGQSPLSNLISFFTTVPTAPSVPAITKTDYGDEEIYLYVAAGSDGGEPVTSLTGSCTDGESFYSGSSSSNFITVSGLSNGTAYTCVVSATNAIGTSPNSASSGPITPEALPTGLPIWLLYEATR